MGGDGGLGEGGWRAGCRGCHTAGGGQRVVNFVFSHINDALSASVVADRFYIALVSALEQTHCACMYVIQHE